MKEYKRVECIGSNGCIDKCWKPKREWVGLTKEDIASAMILNKALLVFHIETVLKEKNYDDKTTSKKEQLPKAYSMQ